MTIEHDEQGRPCLTMFTGITPASSHDSLALDAAIERLCYAPQDSDEMREAVDEIKAIAARGRLALG